MKLVILLSLGVAPLRADARLGDGSHAEDHLESTRRLQACGTPSGGECERDYQLDLVKKSAAEHEVFDPILRQDNARARHLAQSKCKGGEILPEGGWCLMRAGARHVGVPNGHSYLVPRPYSSADPGIVRYLVSMVDENPEVTINDFGAGVGQYGHELMGARPKAKYLGYDGAGNVEHFSHQFIQWFDLSKPQALPKADWVMSFEVGEHVPHALESMVIRNLHAHNTKGMILSWARIGQGGHGHVNNHSSQYLVKLLDELGYDYDEAASVALRAAAARPWFRDTIHIFRRR